MGRWHIGELRLRRRVPELTVSSRGASDKWTKIKLHLNQRPHPPAIRAKEAYIKLHKLGARKEDARYVLPNATGSQIVMTANFREWRHIIGLRGKPQSQWEIRRAAIEILKILKNHAPTVFGDFEVDEEKEIIKEV